MTCCICGRIYDPVERNKQYFRVTDTQECEVMNIHNLMIDGKVLALCATCTKAAGFGKLEFSKHRRFVYNERLQSQKFEVDQEWADWNQPKSSVHATGFKHRKKKVS